MGSNQQKADDRRFVEECVRAYYARAPLSIRLRVPRPFMPPPASRRVPGDKSWPFTVPPEMQGGPGVDGLVTWEPVFCDPKKDHNPYGSFFGPPDPVLRRFLTHVRLCDPLIRTRAISFRLPNVPTHDDRKAGRVLCAWLPWRRVTKQTGCFVLGETEDGGHLVCLDRKSSDGTQPLVLVSRREAYLANYLTDPVTFTPLFPTVRAFLTESLLNNDYPWTGQEVGCERVPVNQTDWRPFDWDPLLLPEPAPNEEAPDQQDVELTPEQVDLHLDRIAAKIEQLRKADPGCLIAGSDIHRYRLNPTLPEEVVSRFEADEGCPLPTVYRRLITRLGDGGFGSGILMGRLLDSGIDRVHTTLGGWPESVEGRLGRPFPHRRAWFPARPPFTDDSEGPAHETFMAYHTRRHFDGALVIEPRHDGFRRKPLVLVARGPERGHLWWDGRSVPVGPIWLERQYLGATDDLGRFEPGIHPVFRRGPYSLLAWLEQALDFLLGRIDGIYARLPNLAIGECIALREEAFRLNGLPR